jgi:glucose/arabinose dehydrogenase/mono/diheme cytochrome c family protein
LNTFVSSPVEWINFPMPALERTARRHSPVMALTLLAVVGLCLLLSQPITARAGLIHRWGFDEPSGTNLTDSVGAANGSVVVIGGGVDYSRGAGYVRLAGGSRSTADYMRLPSGLVNDLTNVTIEVWARPITGQTWSRIFDFGPGNGTGTGDFYLSFCRGAGTLNEQRMEHDPAPIWRTDTAISTTASNQYHYVATWSKTGGANGGGRAAWYRNGVLISAVDTGNAWVANVNDTVLWLGRSQFASDNTANADYNEFRIYNHAMSASEVYSSGQSGPDVAVTPPSQASALTLSTNGATGTMMLNWTQGAGSSGSLVVMSAGQAPVYQPTNGNNYTASATFGSGANLGASNYVVYASSGGNVTVSNITPGKRYYAVVYSYTGSGAARVYNLADAPAANELAFGIAQSINLQVPASLTLFGSGTAVVNADYGAGNVSDVTSLASIVSANTNSVQVTSNGTLLAKSVGVAQLTAAYQGKLATNTVTVVDPRVANLTHRYTFAADASDVVGTAHGLLMDGATVSGNQLILNGTTAYLDLPDGIIEGYDTITVEAWVSNTLTETWSRIFDFGNNTTVNMFLTPRADSGTGPIRFALTLGGGGGSEQRVNGITALPVNTLRHVALTLEGNVAILYVDGSPVGSNTTMTLTPASMGSTTQNYVGKSQYNDPFFDGSIDEFRIYDVALSATMIATNFQNGPDGVAVTPPVVVNDYVTLNQGASVLIPVLANDIGPVPVVSTLAIVNPPGNGTATIKPDGKVLYTHNGTATASDVFTYRVQGVLGTTSEVASVWITVTEDLRLAASSLTLPPSPPVTGYQLVNAFPGLTFEDALAIATPPGRTNQLFVAERRGRISYVPDINAPNPTREVFLDISSQVVFDNQVEGEMGLLGMAFHPNFEVNGYFYVFYIAPGVPYTNRLARFQADPVTLTVNTNTQQPFFDVRDQQFNHNGGDLHFGPDGYLYIGTGDEGNQYNAELNAQRIDRDLYSALLRIDVDRASGIEPRPSANTTRIYTNNLGQAYYSIPASNPYVNATSYMVAPINTNALRAEIFATGFRHIWRFSIDTNSEIWVGDVGQDRYEEINVVTNGGNYGWAWFEGYSNALALYPSQSTLLVTNAASDNTPLYVYPHNSQPGDPQFKGNSVTGGRVYRGSRIPELSGAYVFGDFVSGHIWALWRSNNVVVATNRLVGSAGVAAFGYDPGNGDILVANYAQNQIQRLVKVDVSAGPFPQKLSDTGAFADLATLAPNPGMVNYEPVVSFWSDNALKQRWFAQADLSSQITHVTDGNWGLPPGMVWVKHFDFELQPGNPASKKRLETRFIVKSTNTVYGVSYAWNNAGTEAYLAADGGTNFNLVITNGLTTVTQQWGIPSRTECMVCHTEVGGHALSFNTRQLNQSATLNGHVGNQLATLSAAGYFTDPVAAPQTLPAFAHATNTAVSLEHRARSYFAVNCAQCHQSGGSGPSTWDARAWLSLDQTSLIDGTPYNNGANPANKLVVPGDTAHSVVFKRILGDGFSRMPPLATVVIDQGASNLLSQWISTELTNRLTFTAWQLANFGATNDPNAQASADPDGDGANNYYEWITQTPPLTNVPPPWSVAIDQFAGTVSVSFPRVANLGFVVETGNTLGNWAAWDVPDNQLWFSASDFEDTVTGPFNPTETNRFFRVQIVTP